MLQELGGFWFPSSVLALVWEVQMHLKIGFGADKSSGLRYKNHSNFWVLSLCCSPLLLAGV